MLLQDTDDGGSPPQAWGLKGNQLAAQAEHFVTQGAFLLGSLDGCFCGAGDRSLGASPQPRPAYEAGVCFEAMGPGFGSGGAVWEAKAGGFEVPEQLGQRGRPCPKIKNITGLGMGLVFSAKALGLSPSTQQNKAKQKVNIKTRNQAKNPKNKLVGPPEPAGNSAQGSQAGSCPAAMPCPNLGSLP